MIILGLGLGVLIIIVIYLGIELYLTQHEFEAFKKDVYTSVGIILKRIDKIESQKYLVKDK